jgi:hypothetical protein
MRTFKTSATLAAAFVGLFVASASAQETVIAKIPFSFVVHGKEYSAGRYNVSNERGILTIRNMDNGGGLFLLPIPADGRDPAGDQVALVFTRYENTYACRRSGNPVQRDSSYRTFRELRDSVARTWHRQRPTHRPSFSSRTGYESIAKPDRGAPWCAAAVQGLDVFGKLTTSIAIATAAIAVAIRGYAIVNSSSSNGESGTAKPATLAQSGQNRRVVGQVPQNWRPGTGTIITGAAANEAKAAALAKYPGGTVNRVLKLGDGSYAVHMIKISWPHHVFVSKDFKVSGAVG